MKMKELQSKSTQDLQTMLLELQERLQAARFDLAASRLSNPRSIREIRRDIARVNTAMQSVTATTGK